MRLIRLVHLGLRVLDLPHLHARVHPQIRRVRLSCLFSDQSLANALSSIQCEPNAMFHSILKMKFWREVQVLVWVLVWSRGWHVFGPDSNFLLIVATFVTAECKQYAQFLLVQGFVIGLACGVVFGAVLGPSQHSV